MLVGFPIFLLHTDTIGFDITDNGHLRK